MNGCVGQGVALNNGEKGGSGSVRNQLHIPQSLLLRHINQPELPHIVVGDSPSVVLHKR